MSDIPDDETIRVRPSRAPRTPGPELEPDVDEITEVSLRRASRRAVAAPEIDEATGVSHRRSPVPDPRTPPPALEGDEATQVTDRRGPDPAVDAPDVSDASDAGDAASGPRRSTYIHSVLDTDESTDGSTIVARRESRRRAARGVDQPDSAPAPGIPRAAPTASTAPAGAAAVGDGRVASSPDGTREVFGVRRAQPLVVERISPPPRARQAPQDLDAADARARRADRRATIIVVSTASAVVVAAATALIAIVLAL